MLCATLAHMGPDECELVRLVRSRFVTLRLFLLLELKKKKSHTQVKIC